MDKLEEEMRVIRQAVVDRNAERDKIKEKMKTWKTTDLRPGESDMVHRVPKVEIPRPEAEVWMSQSAAILRWLEYDHLPEYLQVTSSLFSDLATAIAGTIPPGRERTVALRKLLESKDAAVRATIAPGG